VVIQLAEVCQHKHLEVVLLTMLMYTSYRLPEEFRYLGVIFHATKGVSACCNSLTTAGRRAMWSMTNCCAESNLQSLSMQVHLFGALVAPILSYCSEVWGPALLSKGGIGRSSAVIQMLTYKSSTCCSV
jgi:hypothetical protein